MPSDPHPDALRRAEEIVTIACNDWSLHGEKGWRAALVRCIAREIGPPRPSREAMLIAAELLSFDAPNMVGAEWQTLFEVAAWLRAVAGDQTQ